MTVLPMPQTMLNLKHQPTNDEVNDARQHCRGGSPLFAAIARFVGDIFYDNPHIDELEVQSDQFRTRWDRTSCFSVEYTGQTSGCDQHTGVTFDDLPSDGLPF